MAVTIKTGDLASLRQKLKAERKLLEERERAMAIVEQMLREENAGDQPMLFQEEHKGQSVNSLPGAVRKVVTEFHQDFCVPDIELRMKTVGYVLPRKNPRSRIAMILQKMRDKKEIVLVREGKGRVPNRYRAAE